MSDARCGPVRRGALGQRIASLLGVSGTSYRRGRAVEARRIRFIRVVRTGVGVPPRHIFACVVHGDGRRGFAKIACDERARRALAYESTAACAAAALGYPSVPVITPYREDGRGVAVLEYEFIGRREAHRAANTLAARSQLPAVLGRVVAEMIVAGYGRAITSEAAWGALRAPERWLASPARFREELEREEMTLLAVPHRPLVDALVRDHGQPRARGGAAMLRELFAELRDTLAVLGAMDEPAPGPGAGRCGAGAPRYFAVNDLAPHNLFFPRASGAGTRFASPVLVFDWEGAGVVSNAILAALVDWGNFFARCDPNTRLQQAFLRAVLRRNPLRSLDATHALLRCAVVSRTVFAAHIWLDPTSARHDRAVSLLRNLLPNLRRLARAYRELRATPRAITATTSPASG